MDVKTLISATRIFRENEWSLTMEENFDRFCATIETMSEKERLLFFQLTRRYLIYPFSQYQTSLIRLLDSLYGEVFEMYSEIYVLPLLTKSDIKKSKDKSGVLLKRILESKKHTLSKNFKTKNIYFLSRPSNEHGLPKSKKFNNAPGKMILLLDDFIGSGETALAAVRYLSNELGYDKNRIVILSLVAQKFGLQELKKNYIRAYTGKVRKKGISNYYTDEELTEAKSIMECIETKLSVKSKYNFGYRKSEALVTMDRTPNNTFPIYWLSPPDDDRVATFPR